MLGLPRSGSDLSSESMAQVGTSTVDVLPQARASELDIARDRAMCDLAVLGNDVPIARVRLQESAAVTIV